MRTVPKAKEMPLKNKKRLRIGIVGCGAIGSSLARSIVKEFPAQAKLTSLFDIDSQKASRLAKTLGYRVCLSKTLERLIINADLVIEAASAASALKIARESITRSRDIMIMSVGGIIGDYKKLTRQAKTMHVRVFIPSGAICGIDGLKAAVCGKIESVTLTTRKHPKAFSGVPYLLKKKVRLDKIKKEKVLFMGNAISAVKAFPQNINVAAILSIAGIGPQKTIVRIVASPDLTQNTHEIEIRSNAGRIISRTENVVHPDNPKTSYLAVLSAVATLKQILAPLKIGN
ncbi:aspartate dehydrogenase [bacterium]|nr:MAG: aspartate dehydrogenase [bacterium]